MLPRYVIILFSFLIFGQSAITAQEVLDGIVAIVGNNIITKSELEQTAQSFAFQSGINSSDEPEKYAGLKKEQSYK